MNYITTHTKTIIFTILFCANFNSIFAQVKDSTLKYSADRIVEVFLHNNDYLTGGVVCVVQSDSILFNNAYGLADRENKIPFNSDKTIVQIASVTKLITATAILQLIEKGKIELDAPIAKYFTEKFIKNPFEKQVLVKHLLTHTAGFDDRSSFMTVNNQEDIIPLDIYNQEYLPPVVWEPGLYFNYSNYSFNLLAYLVEKVSGQKFEDYVKQNILIPLEMKSSGVGYSGALTKNLMQRYKNKYNDGEEDKIYSQLQPLKFTNIPGADDFKTVPKDMANLMIMYLNGGVFKGKQILKSETIQKAFETHFTYHKSMTYQQGLGWRILNRDGIKIMYHDGDDTGIESSLVLFPEKKIGLFTAFNNEIGNDVKSAILDSMFLILYPSLNKEALNASKVLTSPELLIGNYLYMNDGQENFEKIQYLFDNGRMEITANADTLFANGKKYFEIEPLLFDRIGKLGRLIFIKDEEGRVTALSFGSATYKKINIINDPGTHRLMLASGLLLIVISLVVSLVRFIVTKIKKRETALIIKKIRFIHFNALVLLSFFITFVIISSRVKIGGDIPGLLKLALVFPMLSLLLLPFSLYKCYFLLKDKTFSLSLKIIFTLSVLSIMVVTLILNEYNFVGFHFK